MRKAWLSGLALNLLSAASSAQELPVQGCFAVGNTGRDNHGIPIIDTLGNDNFDAHIIGLFREMASMAIGHRNLSISFSFYDDSAAPNARAIPVGVLGGDYTVVLGRALANGFAFKIGNNDLDTVGVQSVLMHEVAHIGQYISVTDGSVKKRELMADVMSGWWVGISTQNDPDAKRKQRKIKNAIKTAYKMGDFAFNDPDHHGTPDERLQAFQFGLDTSRRSNYPQMFWPVMQAARERYGAECHSAECS